MKNFAISGGSVIGSHHAAVFKPNQDFYFKHVEEDIGFGMVSDGCGSGAYSQFGSIFLCRSVQLELQRIKQSLLQADRERVRELLHYHLRRSLRSAYVRIIHDMGLENPRDAGQFLLATMLGFVLTENYLVLFHCGDGYYRLESDVIHECSVKFEGNAPPYFVYSLFPDELPEYGDLSISFSIHEPKQLTGLLLSTDGIDEVPTGEIKELFTKDLYVKNPEALQRFLQKRAREELNIDFDNRDLKKTPPMLKDDTTAILVRRV